MVDDLLHWGFVAHFLRLPFYTQASVAFVVILALLFHIRFSQKTVAYAPTILTTTGIFFTFVGIAVGLSDFDAGNLQDSVPALLGGLKTAFWASVSGVGGALSIKFRHYLFGIPGDEALAGSDGEVTAEDLARLLSGIQQALVGTDEGTLISQLKLSRQDTNDRLDALKKAQLEALQKLSEMGSKTLVEALRNVISDFNSKITEQFGDNFKRLNEAVGKLLSWQDQYKSFVDQITLRLAEITRSMTTASNSYSELVNKAGVFTKVSEDLSVLLTGFDEQKERLNTALQALANLLSAASGSLPQIEAKVLELTGQLSNAVQNNQQVVSKTLAENSLLMRTSTLDSVEQIKLGISEQQKAIGKSLSDSLLAIQSVQQDVAKTLAENSSLVRKSTLDSVEQIKTGLSDQQKAISKSLSDNVLLIKTSVQATTQDLAKVNQDTNKQIADLVTKTKEQVSVLDAALAEELKKSLESLGRQLAALSEKFVSDYGPLTDKLADIVRLGSTQQ